jgi:hypothetical protein
MLTEDPPGKLQFHQFHRSFHGVTTRKCANCPVRDAAAMLARSAIHDFKGASEVAKVAVYRKALFRDRDQTIKRTLFTLAPRPDALRGVFQPLNRRKFTLNALNCPIWVSLEPDNSDTFVSLPVKRIARES